VSLWFNGLGGSSGTFPSRFPSWCSAQHAQGLAFLRNHSHAIVLTKILYQVWIWWYCTGVHLILAQKLKPAIKAYHHYSRYKSIFLLKCAFVETLIESNLEYWVEIWISIVLFPTGWVCSINTRSVCRAEWSRWGGSRTSFQRSCCAWERWTWDRHFISATPLIRVYHANFSMHLWNKK